MLRLTLRTAPTALSYQEPATNRLGVHLAGLLIDNRLLRLHHGPGLALIVNTDDLIAQLKLAARASRREGFQDGQLALAVDSAAEVQLGNTGDLGC